jgi:aarF domain-containing kinase
MTLQRAGPTFCKLGQWGSTRPDILPIDLCTELSKLQSSVPPHPMSWNHHIIKSAFGLPLDQVFEYFSPLPAGSGTVGQVHQARLKENPKEVVAVKIIHPGIHDRIKSELLLVDFIAKVLDNIPGLNWMGFREQARLFKHMMMDQLDLRQEAWTLSRFSFNLRNNYLVQFARPILSTPDLLIETWQEGISLDRFIKDNPETSIESRKLAEAGLSAFLKMLLWDNFIHADLHPGNLKVSLLKPSKLIFLDTGLTIELSGKDHDNLADLFRYLFIERNSQRVAQLLLERKPQPQVLEPEKFIKEFSTLCDRILPLSTQLSSIKLSNFPIGETLINAFELARRHRVQLEPAFTRVIMSLVVIEGVGRQLAPDLQLLPIIRQAAFQYLISETARRLTQKVQPIL